VAIGVSTAAQPLLQVAGWPELQSSVGSSQQALLTAVVHAVNCAVVEQLEHVFVGDGVGVAGGSIPDGAPTTTSPSSVLRSVHIDRGSVPARCNSHWHGLGTLLPSFITQIARKIASHARAAGPNVKHNGPVSHRPNARFDTLFTTVSHTDSSFCAPPVDPESAPSRYVTS
jgi:hypothetical protein